MPTRFPSQCVIAFTAHCVASLVGLAASAPAAQAQRPGDQIIAAGIMTSTGMGNAPANVVRGNKSVSDHGYSWRLPDAPPLGDTSQPAQLRWNRPYPDNFAYRSDTFQLLFSGISGKGAFPQPSPAEYKVTDFSKYDLELLDTGYNVRRLRDMTAADFAVLKSFGESFRTPGPNDPPVQRGQMPPLAPKDRPAMLETMRTNAGLLAIPDQRVTDAAARFQLRRSEVNHTRITAEDQAADAKILCDYFATNQELSIIRSLVLDPGVVAQRSKLTEQIRTKGSYNVTTPAIARATQDLMTAMDVAGVRGLSTDVFPTPDEIRGIENWANYFTNREAQTGLDVADMNGQTRKVYGEQAVGGYLDSPATGAAMKMLRYDGTNARPLPMTPPEVRAELDRGSAEPAGSRPHDWTDVAANVYKTYRDARDEREKKDKAGNGEPKP